MKNNQTIIIIPTPKDQQQQDGIIKLTPLFFQNLHQLQVKYIRLRYCKTSKHNQSELIENIQKLVAYYTDCIDYFSNISQNVQTYYQAKLKDIIRYYQLFKNVNSQSYLSFHKDNNDELETIQDLGSISSQTRLEIMIQERDESVASKEIFNQNVMVCLQNQNINIHLKQNMKKKDKVNNKINESLQHQVDDIQKRIKGRKIRMAKKKASQSFSQQTTFQADLKKQIPMITEQMQQLMDFNMEALDLDSPEKLKELIQSKNYQTNATHQHQL